MTGRIEKTIFISYRRTNLPWALNIYQDLTHHGYDVFFDYQSIDSGDFDKIIIDNIKARAHFIVVLTPSALDRCKEPNDWLRREIETALEERRNIVPLIMEGFDFGSLLVAQALTGKLAALRSKNGLPIYAEYFFEGMEKLRNRYLNVALSDVPLQPLSTEAREFTEAQKSAASEAPPVEKQELTAQEWFERGVGFSNDNNFEEAIRCYTQAISIQPDFTEAYVSRGASYGEKGDLDKATSDLEEGVRLQPNNARAFNNLGVALHTKGELSNSARSYTEAIRLEPDLALAFSNRASVYTDLGNYAGAIEDCTKAVQLNPNLSEAYNNRGAAFHHTGEMRKAIKDYTKAIRLKSDYAEAYRNRGTVRDQIGDTNKAIQDYTKAIRLKPEYADAFYDRGIVHQRTGHPDTAIKDYTQAILIKPDFADAYKNRGIAFETIKDFTSAIMDYQKYLKMGGQDRNVNLWIKNLRKNIRTNKKTRKH